MRFLGLLFIPALACVLYAAPVSAQDGAETSIQPIAYRTEDLSVKLDLASVIRVPVETTTIVIGNPAIADATIQRNGLIVITGKSYGTTNVLALDRDGATLRELMVSVHAPTEQTVTVLRGGLRETWSCTPRCEQTVTLGDAPDFFGNSSGQTGTRNGMAGAK